VGSGAGQQQQQRQQQAGEEADEAEPTTGTPPPPPAAAVELDADGIPVGHTGKKISTHPYKAEDADELQLLTGDIVYLL
jgi:hypothetical protein